jgi:ATP/maltotriose-dependent transcriptional regulator MalT
MLRRWLAAVPVEHWPRFPRLYLVRGNCEIAVGEDRAAMQTLEEGRRHLRDARDLEAESEAIRILGHLSVWEGERDRLHQLARDIMPRVAEFPPAARARVLEVIARAAMVNGELARAEAVYRDAIAAAQASGTPAADLTPRRYLAALLAEVGRFRESAALSEELLTRYQRLG